MVLPVGVDEATRAGGARMSSISCSAIRLSVVRLLRSGGGVSDDGAANAEALPSRGAVAMLKKCKGGKCTPRYAILTGEGS
jgi:hypothetical protein